MEVLQGCICKSYKGIYRGPARVCGGPARRSCKGVCGGPPVVCAQRSCKGMCMEVLQGCVNGVMQEGVYEGPVRVGVCRSPVRCAEVL